MKNFILPLVSFLLLMSCSEDEVIPTQDPFIGSWHLDNYDIDLHINFDVIQDNNNVSFKNVNIEFPGIPEGINYRVEPYYRFPVNAGYKEIKMFSSEVALTMIHNRVHLKTPDIMDVYIIEIAIANQEPIVLENQVFTKSIAN